MAASTSSRNPDFDELPPTRAMAKIAVHAGDASDLEAFLAQRIYEYNAAATGYQDAESFSAFQQGESGVIEAGVYGYTWGGCCYVSALWVSEPLRNKGLGTELLEAVECHARDRRCRLVLLSSHSFQSPEFYARRGYKQVARVDDYPIGHSDIVFTRRLVQ